VDNFGMGLGQGGGGMVPDCCTQSKVYHNDKT
jgi:hypothetical protein